MNIIVLCGGLSGERDVSLISGSLVTKALREMGHRAVPIDLFFGYTGSYADAHDIFLTASDAGAVSIGEDAPDLAAVRAMRRGDSESVIGDNVIEVCRAADLVFMALHGAEGENGKLQALFDIMGIRYTGCGSLASAIAMNKELAKLLMERHGVLVPHGITVRAGDTEYPCPPLPCMVKPLSGGSSIGASIVRRKEEYPGALETGFAADSELMVEDFITGRECDVGVLMGKALPVIEICPRSGFYDYRNKYQAGLTDEYCPADIPPEVTEKLQKAAVAVYNALGMEVYGRMDFIVRDDGAIFCLEANTLPGMTPTSLMPQEAAAAGMSYNELCAEIIRGSLAKYSGGGTNEIH